MEKGNTLGGHCLFILSLHGKGLLEEKMETSMITWKACMEEYILHGHWHGVELSH